ncbi:MAG: twin transmembrane helix small protein [Candidatus Rariloculaceae bacterium]
MLNFLIIVIMLGILISLASGLFFLVRDKGKTKRTIASLSLRVALSVVLLALLAYGFITRFIVPGS